MKYLLKINHFHPLPATYMNIIAQFIFFFNMKRPIFFLLIRNLMSIRTKIRRLGTQREQNGERWKIMFIFVKKRIIEEINSR